MDWREFIVVDDGVLVGKPIVKGTRLSVEFILGLLSQGWDKKEILENYPTLTNEALSAVFAFSSECMKEESFYSISKIAA